MNNPNALVIKDGNNQWNVRLMVLHCIKANLITNSEQFSASLD